MGTTVELQAKDGHRCSAYRADPEGQPRGALVIVQEIFGVNSHIRAVTDSWAQQGYVALAPALFDRVQPGVELGYTPETTVQGRALRTEVGTDGPLLDLEAAVTALSQHGKVGMVGFCWGGLLTWLAAGRIEGLAAAVCYYGGGIVDRAEQPVRCPVQLHFGERDKAIPVERVVTLRGARPELEVHLYPADHGFSCNERAAYDDGAARLARERTGAFLAKHVG